jgi:two-component system sensor histidine kinase UhpB
LRNEIEAVSTEIRRICEDLSPSVLTNVGLTAALEWALTNAVAHMPPQERFEYEFICDDELEDRINFDENVQIQLYRVVQEAISNTCRHAKAKKVKLIVALTEDNLFSLKLIDDGKGFSSRRIEGRGLNNMRSRANMIEAEVDWQSRPTQGTTFTLSRFNTNNNKPDDLEDIDKL